MYGLIDLSNSNWSRKRIAKALRELVVSACREPLPLRRARLEIAARDLAQRSGSVQRVASADDTEVSDWLLSTLEIGHAVIALREQMNEISHESVSSELSNCLNCIADLYASTTTQHRIKAMSAIDAAMAVLSDANTATNTGVQLSHASRHQLKTMLHFIHSALLDEESVLGSVAPLPKA
jgi:hypothetical protein